MGAFSNQVWIWSSNRFDTLTFNADSIQTVRLMAGGTQAITDIVFNATCAKRVTVRSDWEGQTAYIYKSSGAVNEDYLNIRDITVLLGGATFTSNNSINMGNVFNWTINSSTPVDYYWIGDGGDWSDTLHWSLTSGGPPNTGGCIPTDVDNVFFDDSSFTLALGQIVTVDVDAFCNSMD